MHSPAVVLSAFLFCNGLTYIFIWSRIPETFPSFQMLSNYAQTSDWFWGDGNETEGEPEALMSSTNSSSGNNMSRAADLVTVDAPEHGIHITPIPLYYKKNFTKLPRWDFEDVYNQDSEARRPVCPKSLQYSADKEFQKNAMFNIQLWLYKGLLNVTEWNRLAHFSNPYGFMEYNYSYIKTIVDLLPKPKYNQLLPVPNGSADGCIRCAVVGTSGILNGSRLGKEIDSHDYVFRMNGAVTKGYEDDVGNRTSVYVHTSYSLTQYIIRLHKRGFKHIPQDEGIKYVMITESIRDFHWLEGLLLKIRRTNGSYTGYRPHTYYGDKFKLDEQFYVLHPDFLRYVSYRFLPSKNMEKHYWGLYRPTNGAYTLFIALQTCDIVDVYGYITEDHKKFPNYYFDMSRDTRVIFFINHDYNKEKDTWKKLHDAGIINLYQRKENISQTGI